jgi:hypothetical protein
MACNEPLQGLRFGEIQSASQAGQDHAQAEHVGQRIVVTQLVLPSNVARQVHGASDRDASLADGQVNHVLLSGICFASPPDLRHDLHGGLAGRFDGPDCGRVTAGRLPLRLLEPDPTAFHAQCVETFERCHLASRMRLQHLAHQRQKRGQRVLRAESVSRQACP